MARRTVALTSFPWRKEFYLWDSVVRKEDLHWLRTTKVPSRSFVHHRTAHVARHTAYRHAGRSNRQPESDPCSCLVGLDDSSPDDNSTLDENTSISYHSNFAKRKSREWEELLVQSRRVTYQGEQIGMTMFQTARWTHCLVGVSNEITGRKKRRLEILNK